VRRDERFLSLAQIDKLYHEQCFLKVFERVSWWSFRVPTPFSLLCLILLTHFHKNVSFRPNMLNYLNTTFPCVKQTTDNFLNRRVQDRRTYSFIYSFWCPLFLWGKSGESSSPRRTRNTSRSTAISDSSVGFTPRPYQARSEMKLLQLVLGQTLGRFPVGVCGL